MWVWVVFVLQVIMGVSGFLLGYCISSILTCLVDSAVHTVYVCWILHPDDLKRCHQKQYRQLAAAFTANHETFMAEREKFIVINDA